MNLWNKKYDSDKIAYTDLLTSNDGDPGVHGNTRLFGTLNYEWEYHKVKRADHRTLTDVFLNFSNFQLHRSLGDSLLSNFVLIVNSMSIKVTFEEVPEERTVRMKCLKFVQWEGFSLEPIEGAKWGRLKWLILKTVQLLSSNFIVKYAIQVTLAERVMSALDFYSYQQEGERMFITTATPNNEHLVLKRGNYEN
ncbi:unnamed protein product [Rodentolepis nana]|uniref:Glyco_hydro_65N domain-containing protein n=1 Tax=Rodentolepis nana TaxID=102285 RepID=A0A0R3TU35_RODNA|nr:unnamed protein product [Rodentolepis nana]